MTRVAAIPERPSLVMEDPPPTRGRWRTRLEPLMEFPGAWVNLTKTYDVHPTSGAHSHLVRREYDYPPGRWEFRQCRIGKPDAALYARYLGPETETS